MIINYFREYIRGRRRKYKLGGTHEEGDDITVRSPMMLLSSPQETGVIFQFLAHRHISTTEATM